MRLIIDSKVYSDETLLAQILQNLLSNALKFTANGIIQIGAREINEGRSGGVLGQRFQARGSRLRR